MSAQRIGRTAVALGGVALAVGAATPWMTLFGGLQTYRGLIGLNGRLLLATGASLAVVSLARRAWTGRRTQRALVGVSAATVAFCAWLIVGLVGMVHRGSMAMLVPGFGPGLFVAQAGALLCLGGAVMLVREGHRTQGRFGT